MWRRLNAPTGTDRSWAKTSDVTRSIKLVSGTIGRPAGKKEYSSFQKSKKYELGKDSKG